jgi:hypothetical protein
MASKDASIADIKSAKSDPKSTKTLPPTDGKQTLIHIDNFDAKKYHVINSPRSRAAMTELGIQDKDLHLKTADDLRGMFDMTDEKEKKAFELCVKKHETAHKNIVKKISDRRKELIKGKEENDKKKKEHDLLRSKQLKQLEEEKKIILKTLELEQKKREEEEKKKKLEREKELKKDVKTSDDKAKKPADDKSKAPADDKSKPAAPADDKSKPAAPTDDKSKKPDDGKKDENQKSAASLSPDKKGAKDTLPQREKSALTHKSDREKKLKLDDELKESSILMFLDKSANHKELLDLDLKERTKRDLERDKQRMKDLMKRQKFELLEMAQKRAASAYKSHENLGNAKTRKIEYLYEISRNPVESMKEKQQKEMESMMNYEIALQVILIYSVNQKTKRGFPQQ